MKRPQLFSLMTLVFLVCAPSVTAYVASSSNYVIETDSVNSGGGLSSSPSYVIQDTLTESAVGTSGSASYAVKAGYQQMQDVFLAVSLPSNVSLLPNIPSVGGGTAQGLTSFTVTTDNRVGYAVEMGASTSPALVSGPNSFGDYVPAGAFPDLSFSVPPASSRFGFTPEGLDIVPEFQDDGFACGVASGDTPSACWRGLSTTPIPIASRNTANHPSGTVTTLRFRAEADVAHVQPAGSYQGTVTLTVIAL